MNDQLPPTKRQIGPPSRADPQIIYRLPSEAHLLYKLPYCSHTSGLTCPRFAPPPENKRSIALSYQFPGNRLGHSHRLAPGPVTLFWFPGLYLC